MTSPVTKLASSIIRLLMGIMILIVSATAFYQLTMNDVVENTTFQVLVMLYLMAIYEIAYEIMYHLFSDQHEDSE